MDKNYHIFFRTAASNGARIQFGWRPMMAKKHIPVEHAEAIYLHGQIDYNTRLMSFLNDHGVAVHVFGWNDRYAGSLMPERGQTSGRTVVEQVRAYDDPEQRQSRCPRSSVGVSTTCGRTSRTTTVGSTSSGA